MDSFMLMAYKEAQKAYKSGEVPVGCVIVRDGQVISKAHNERERRQSALAHAEILAIDRACKKLNSFRLDGCHMYLTLEPCPMCTGAIINSRIDTIHFATSDSHYGCCGSRYNLVCDKNFEHTVNVIKGEMEEECTFLLTSFFERVREKNKVKNFLSKYVKCEMACNDCLQKKSKNIKKNGKNHQKNDNLPLFSLKIDNFPVNAFILCEDLQHAYCKFILEKMSSFDTYIVLADEHDDACLFKVLSSFSRGTKIKVISSDGKKIIKV